jgi:hypothetical protein
MRRVQPGQLLVRLQQRHRRMVDLTEQERPGRRQLDPVPPERAQQVARGVRVHLPPAEREPDPLGQLGKPRRPRTTGRPRPQRVGQ